MDPRKLLCWRLRRKLVYNSGCRNCKNGVSLSGRRCSGSSAAWWHYMNYVYPYGTRRRNREKTLPGYAAVISDTTYA